MTLARLRPLLLCVLVVPAGASAQRVSVLDFSGPGGAALRASLVPRLCDTADCVAANKVTSAGKPDGKKARRELLQYLVQGAVLPGKGRTPPSLDVTVLAAESGALVVKARRAFPLDARLRLAPRTLPGVVEFVKAAVQPPPPEPARPPPAAARPPPPAPEPAAPPPSPVAQRPVPAPPERRQPFVAVEVGADVTVRSLTYAGLTTNNLRDYQPFPYAMPRVRVELYPLALGRSDLLAGLGLEASFGWAPYLRTVRAAGTPEAFPTSASRLDVALRWRLLPLPSYALAITPSFGWRLQRFIVGALPDGTRLDGLPGISFNGLRAGLELEAPVVPELLVVIARGGVLPVLSAGEIISPAYLAAGTTLGIEAAGGLAVQLAPWLQLRATFEFTQYQLGFTTAASDAHIASSAVERSLGGNVSGRLQL